MLVIGRLSIVWKWAVASELVSTDSVTYMVTRLVLAHISLGN